MTTKQKSTTKKTKQEDEGEPEGLELNNMKMTAQSYWNVVEDYVIPDDDEFEAAGAFSKTIAGMLKVLKAEKERVLAPYKAEIEKREVLFKPVIRQLMMAQDRLKEHISNYMLLAREKQAALAKAATKAPEAETASALMKSARLAAPPKLDGVSGRSVWKFTVVDLDKVPDEYCCRVLDEGLVKDAIAKGERSIPGLVIHEQMSLTVRSGAKV